MKKNTGIRLSKVPKKGQALVALLVFTAVSMILTSGAVAIAIINIQGTGKFSQSAISLQIAESAAENGIIRLLRDPSYTGEDLSINGETVKILVSSGTITAYCETCLYQRKIQVVTTFQNNQLVINSWSEI